MSGEKSPFYYPVCSVHRSLQIKLTKGRLAREKTDFDLYRYMRVHRKKKNVIQRRLLEFGAYVSLCLVAQLVRTLPAIWESWVQSLGQEDPLEKG